MNLIKAVANLAFIGILSACAWSGDEIKNPFTPTPEPIKETEIFLQEPYTRVVVRCSASIEDVTIACAQKFEQKGYVRLKNIPYRVAHYDFLTKDTYPSRRWRFNETSPRW